MNRSLSDPQSLPYLTLKCLAAATVVSAVAIMPGLAKMIKGFEISSRIANDIKRRKLINNNLNKTLRRFIKAGFVKRVIIDNVPHFSLTKAGLIETKRRENMCRTIPLAEKQTRWDKKWHIVIFDVQESKRGSRDALRRQLMRLGLLQIQRSVWVSPYDCSDLVDLYKSASNLSGEVIYAVVDKIEEDEKLRKYFGLETN